MAAKVFYSYSFEDESFMEELERALAILNKNKVIEDWHRRRISPGSNFEEEIDLKLDEADIIILLVSANFLASEYCYDSETVRALEMHGRQEAVVVPVILKHCLWRESHFADLEVLPKQGKPVTTFTYRDEAWTIVGEKISELARKHFIKPSPELKQPSPLDGLSETESLLIKFLCNYHKWYFSPLRITAWGGKQKGFKDLKGLDTKEVREVLEKLVSEEKVNVIMSKKGNRIYQINKNICV